MKKILVLIICVIMVTPNLVLADGIVCAFDQRPIDGGFLEIKLKTNNDKYELTQISGGTRVNPDLKTETLVSNLRCKLSDLIAACTGDYSTKYPYSRPSVAFTKIKTSRLYIQINNFGKIEDQKVISLENITLNVKSLSLEKCSTETPELCKKEFHFSASDCKKL